MSDVNPQTATGDDLDWAAFCYVSDELSVENREIFETRLADDVAACEAVGRAVQVAESASLALSGAKPKLTNTREAAAPRQVSGRAAAAIAVLVATVLVALVPFIQNSGDPATAENETRDADVIVAMWTGSRDLMADSPEASVEPLQPAFELVEDGAEPAVEEVVVAESSVDVPAWLLAAVKAEADGLEVLEN